MQNKTGGKRGPQNTRVYAPTHHAGASPAAGGGQAPGKKNETRASASKQENRQNKGGAGQAPSAAGPDKPQARYHAEQTVYAPKRQQTRQQAYQPSKGSRQPPVVPGGRAMKDNGPKKAGQKRNPKKKGGPAGTYVSIQHLESIADTQKAQERERERLKKLEEKKNRQPPDPKKALAYAITAVCLVALLLLGYFLFLLQTVEVEGNEQYPAERIIELSGLTAGTHLLLCDLDGVKANVESNPYLAVASVSLKWPRSIRIAVVERQETAAIQSQDYDVIIDDTGHVLSIGKSSDLSHLLLVTGMSNIGFAINEKIGTSSDLQTQTLLSLIAELEKLELLQEVQRADLANPLHVCLYTKDNIEVVLGQPDGLSEKLAWMRDALPSLRKSGATGGTLDVSAKGGAIYSPPGAAQPLEEEELTTEEPTTGEPTTGEPTTEEPLPPEPPGAQ